jgi:hypothetical protein
MHWSSLPEPPGIASGTRPDNSGHVPRFYTNNRNIPGRWEMGRCTKKGDVKQALRIASIFFSTFVEVKSSQRTSSLEIDRGRHLMSLIWSGLVQIRETLHDITIYYNILHVRQSESNTVDPIDTQSHSKAQKRDLGVLSLILDLHGSSPFDLPHLFQVMASWRDFKRKSSHWPWISEQKCSECFMGSRKWQFLAICLATC